QIHQFIIAALGFHQCVLADKSDVCHTVFHISDTVGRFDQKVPLFFFCIQKDELSSFVLQFFDPIAALFKHRHALFFQPPFGQCDRQHRHPSFMRSSCAVASATKRTRPSSASCRAFFIAATRSFGG